MSAVVSKLITKILCENQGSLNYRPLHSIVRQSFTVADEVIFDVLSDNSKFLIFQGSERKVTDGYQVADSTIVAKTSLRVCQSLSNDCVQCNNLHLCRYFVCGDCRHGNKCKNSHDLNSDHNMAILRSMGLQDLHGAALCCLLLQNDTYLLPMICSHYNKGNGEHGSCKFKAGCTALHICQHFLQGDCKFGSSCKRAHSFDRNAMKILNGRGLSKENIHNLHTIYRNRLLITGQRQMPEAPPTAKPQSRSRQSSSSSVSEADRNEICLYYIHQHCSFKEKCIRIHYYLPYKWQMLANNGTTWTDFPDMEEVERAYCDPENDMSLGHINVDFASMKCDSASVRRLSTASSVTKAPHVILSTQWLWFWRSDNGKWVEYGNEADGTPVTSITSQRLENAYLADGDGAFYFSVGKQQYVLYYKEMYQQNMKYKTKREVKRRPRFVSAPEVQKMISRGEQEQGTSKVTVPPDWDQTALPDFTFKLVPLAATMTEYKEVDKLFKRTMPHSIILTIQRIQNTSLWRVFQWQKEQIQQKTPGKAVDERLLFHGTDPSLKDAICEQNFDWRICGVHGTTFGKGSYFARDAVYSDRYSESRGKGTKIMFVALVLVGEFTKGHSTYLRPPSKGSGAVFYDSCVDSETNPSIFVIFEKHQIYPKYIIEYH